MSDGQNAAANGPTGPASNGAAPPRRGKADHLKNHRFGKGKSGNPNGRPKGSGVTAALRKLLEQVHNGKAIEDLVAERWLKDALSGKSAHLQMLLERTEGKVADKIEATHEQRVYVCPPPRVIGEDEGDAKGEGGEDAGTTG